MNFMYNIGMPSIEKEMKIKIESAANILYNKLLTVDYKSLDISEYSKKYLSEYVNDLYNNMMKYVYLLALSMYEMKDNFTLLEYGAGTGILCMLAKQFGIKQVFYNDIYNVSCHDAEVVAKKLGLAADIYIAGDINDVLKYTKTKNLKVDVIASKDVLEHIYNIDDYINKLSHFSGKSLTIVMTTHANHHNYKIHKLFTKRHIYLEYQNRQKIYGHKERDSLQSYFEIRKKLIKEISPDLPETEYNNLAKQTRGLIYKDIKMYLEQYKLYGNIGYIPKHTTNTCDPLTGNWAEQFIDMNKLNELFFENGFRLKILPGLYGGSTNFIKKIIKGCINVIITLCRNQGVYFAPAYTIYAKKK